MNRLQQLFEHTHAFAEDNAGFLEQLYERYLEDPASVDPSWRERFEFLQWEPSGTGRAGQGREPDTRHEELATAAVDEAVFKQFAVARLVYQYRTRGHQAAENNPLKLAPVPRLMDLNPTYHGLDESDSQREFYYDVFATREKWLLKHIVAKMKHTYCGSIGFEYMHIVDSNIKQWLQHRLERSAAPTRTVEQKTWLLRMLTAAEGIEKYLHRQYVGQKRFSLEGAESLIPLLDGLIQKSGAAGIGEIVIGMAHRGRLNVLVNIMGRKPSMLFQEFEGTWDSGVPYATAGDVKYHMGFSSDIMTATGSVHVALAFNPSHLEIIGPVVEGSVRARQDRYPSGGEDKVMAVIIHGDAAFAGQGVVMETLNMAETRAFTTGGTLHIVVNNQIGFTTSNPFDARSTLYCTDVANMVQAPVFHVNGDDPEAVMTAMELALDYRMKFKRDAVVDLICYRRHGHNEADEPAVTQPAMYRFIRQHPPVTRLYAEQLNQEGVVDPEAVKRMEEDYLKALKCDEAVSRPILRDTTSYTQTRWDHYLGHDWSVPYQSASPLPLIQRLSLSLSQIPERFTLHPRALAIVEARDKMGKGTLPLDWGFGETLAYASVLMDGRSIRLTGQDVGRGTFFHRHAVLFDLDSGDAYIPLQHLGDRQGTFHLYDSLLSEEGVLGFEYGYSSTEPDTLVIWEAQFGDFANNAQVVIDQFIASGESKWGRLSGLTMLLPHGYEGQGPEHSSARLERYLQLCAEQNIQVCVPTTPAQIFHLLRRQIIRPCRKPLIVMTPKSLLRHKLAVSTLEELSQGGYRTVIGEIDPHEPAHTRRVILCSGKVYYDLLEARRSQALDQVVLIRIEQLYPFPTEDLLQELSAYTAMQELIWCQEEPENQGAWHQIKHRFLNLLEQSVRVGYAGRPMSATPAVGQFHRHLQQQKKIVEDALTGLIPPQ
ncbi:MAG: 2-oxoglutarate dehydrogenase E1 component [Methylococcaceae bacterium]